MKIAVVGPSEERDALFQLLQEGCALQGIDAQCICFSTLPELMAVEVKWQLVVLHTDPDYYDLACDFRRQQAECALILWSENDAWSQRSFALHPDDYLIYPIEQKALRKALYHCWTSLLPFFPYIMCSGPQKGRRLRLSEVRYLESFGHTCVLHCAQEEISFNRSLTSMELEARGLLVRCHRSYLVNLYWVDSLEEEAVVMQSGERVPIGDKQRRELQQLWMTFQQKCRPLTAK